MSLISLVLLAYLALAKTLFSSFNTVWVGCVLRTLEGVLAENFVYTHFICWIIQQLYSISLEIDNYACIHLGLL